ncbi:RNA-directed DNA polymerase, eukaryota [Tanacetum coccineum]
MGVVNQHILTTFFVTYLGIELKEPQGPATTTTTTTPIINAQLKALIDQGVADALAARDADRSRNGDDSHNSGTGSRRTERTARECTYTDFLKFENQVKFATCTLHSVALTWCNTHVKTVGHDAAYDMPWKTLMKMMTDKYCPRNEIKKLEMEIWDLKSDKIKKYVGGLLDMIHGSVMASKPKTMQDAIEITTELMDKKISTLAERQAENKRKLDNNNQAQQQPPKKQGVAIAYPVRSGEKKEYAGTLPLCNKGKFHHNGQCTVKCVNCKRVGHLTRDCRSPAATNNQKNLTCYECRNQENYRSDCPKLKNQNHGNQAGGTGARGMVHALEGGEINQDLNNMD